MYYMAYSLPGYKSSSKMSGTEEPGGDTPWSRTVLASLGVR
jgi:hypothetical protein